MSDFGARLRAARERRGVSLREISTRTKISIVALEALERNDPSRLPGGIFARSFVRSYASEVGLDPDATVREFVERFNIDPPFSATLSSSAEEEGATLADASHRLFATVVKIVFASLLVVAVLFYLSRIRHTDDSASATRSDPGRRTSRRLVSSVPKAGELP